MQTAETIWQAKKKCPDLVLLPPHHGLYREYSQKVNAIYDEYTDLVEPFGIDESWLDMTHTLHLFGGDAKAFADSLRTRVRRELGLTLSVGISFNKVFAKLGSDYRKPDATTVISVKIGSSSYGRCRWETFCTWAAPPKKLLKPYGVETHGQLAAAARIRWRRFLAKWACSSMPTPMAWTALPFAPASMPSRPSLSATAPHFLKI